MMKPIVKKNYQNILILKKDLKKRMNVKHQIETNPLLRINVFVKVYKDMYLKKWDALYQM